jgi:hypothetical protein
MGILPYRCKVLLTYIAGGYIKIPTSLYLTDVGDKTEACPCHTAAGIGIQPSLRNRESSRVSVSGTCFNATLPHDSLVMGCISWLEKQPVTKLLLLVANPAQDLLIFFGSKLLVGESFTAAGGHQQKRVESSNLEFKCQLHKAGQILNVKAGDRAVYLHFNTGIMSIFNAFYGFGISTFFPAKFVLQFRTGKSILMLIRETGISFMRWQFRG